MRNGCCKVRKRKRMKKMAPRLKFEVWLGMIHHTSESAVGIYEDILSSRAVRRLDAARKWDAEMVTGIKGTPWDPTATNMSLVRVESHPSARIDKTMYQSAPNESSRRGPSSNMDTRQDALAAKP